MSGNKNSKKVLLPAAIGDWTKYRPSFAETKPARAPLRGRVRLSEKELETVCKNYIRDMESFIETLKNGLESPSVLDLVSIEQLDYSDILKEADMPLVQFRLFDKETLSGYLCLSLELCLCLINRSLGALIPTPRDPKSLTRTEEKVLELCVLEALSGSLKELAPRLANSSSISFDQPFGENGPFVLVSAQIDFGDIKSGKVFLAMPSAYLRSGLESGRKAFNAREVSKLPSAVKDGVFSQIRAVLGSTFISAKELCLLEEGDVILFDSKLNDLVPVYINDCLKLFGQPGIKNERLGIRVYSSEGLRRHERVPEPQPVVEEPFEEAPAYESPEEIGHMPQMEGQMAHY